MLPATTVVRPAPRKTAIGPFLFGRLPCRRQLLRGGEVPVCEPRFQQPPCVGSVPVHPIALEHRTFIPIETQPAKSSQDGLGMLGLGAVAVGILDTEDEHASLVPGEQPVEESGTGAADVKESRRRGSEANLYRHVKEYFIDVV